MIKTLARLLTVRTMRGPNFLIQGDYPLKLHKSYTDQVALLKSRGLIIHDESQAAKVLETVNYYRLSGYLHEFKKNGEDCYIDGLSFENVLAIYHFDAKLTRVLMYALEDVEESLKTRFSYELSSSYPLEPLIYLDGKVYRNPSEFLRFKAMFAQSKRDNSQLPFVKHHIENYNGDLPVWVAVEIMTMGNIHKLYNNLKGCHQKAIAKAYNTGSVQMKSWIENLTYTRNHLAHYMRIYDYSFGRTPALCAKHPQMTQTGRIFDQIMAIGYMFSSQEEWKDYVVPEIKKLIDEYSEYIDLEDIGLLVFWL